MVGWNKVFKDITKWTFYKKPNIFKLYFHLFTLANIKPVRMNNCWIPKGGLLIKESQIGSECGLTYQQVRTAMNNLEKAGEIKRTGYNKFTIVTLVNYEKYLTSGFSNSDDISEAYTGYTEETEYDNAGAENPEPEKKKAKSEEEKERKLTEITEQIEELRKRYSPSQLKIIDDFFDVLKHTRTSAKISESVVLKSYIKFEKYTPDKVVYAMHKYIHNPNLHDKKENYVLGIMRNATAEEITQYKNQISAGGQYGSQWQSKSSEGAEGRFAGKLVKQDSGESG